VDSDRHESGGVFAAGLCTVRHLISIPALALCAHEFHPVRGCTAGSMNRRAGVLSGYACTRLSEFELKSDIWSISLRLNRSIILPIVVLRCFIWLVRRW